MDHREAVAQSSQAREAELERLRRVARLLDSSVTVPGTDFKVGVDSLIGLVPGVGDWVGAAISLSLVHRARKLGVKKRTLGKMLGAVGLEATVGAIPVVGDLFDMAFRANQRIVRMIERDLGQAGADPALPGDRDAEMNR